MRKERLSAAAWRLILCGSLLLMLSFGIRSSMGLFMPPLSAANEWGRDLIGLALAIQNLAWGVIAVVAGGLADRFGTVRVVMAGAVLYALGLWMTAGVDQVWMLHSGAGLLVGAGVAGTAFGIVLPAMARAVSEAQRQWVLGVGTAAGSLGQFLLAPVAQGLIDWLGWAGALNAMALLSLTMALLAMPLAVSDRGEGGVAEIASPEAFRATLRLARGHASYWLLTLGFFVCGFHLAFITVHMPAFLGDAGFDASVGAWSISLIGLCNVVGAFMAGVISSRISKRLVLLVIYAGRAVAITLFMLLPLSLTTVLAFSCVMGLLWLATVPPTSGLVATMFGTRYMATLYGVVFLSHQIGSFTGVWLGGFLYEATGSYVAVWWSGVVLSLVTMALHWPIREAPANVMRAMAPSA
ncbi:MFS transporter [Billgrantia pellis]|uniref:MFS transporter n=1 Tax=Billgrantia pellis TaxID=2606936 RepID=A0A7V7G2W8_9GAMM|nr:MFS transporter [Halomonas pellis]KAA0014574.1 MFS transporter [Halomonas pellis]